MDNNNKVMDNCDINKRYRIIHAEESEELNKFKNQEFGYPSAYKQIVNARSK